MHNVGSAAHASEDDVGVGNSDRPREPELLSGSHLSGHPLLACQPTECWGVVGLVRVGKLDGPNGLAELLPDGLDTRASSGRVYQVEAIAMFPSNGGEPLPWRASPGSIHRTRLAP